MFSKYDYSLCNSETIFVSGVTSHPAGLIEIVFKTQDVAPHSTRSKLYAKVIDPLKLLYGL